MNKKAGFMSKRTANIIVTIYLALAGVITLNYLPHSIPTHLLGISFFIATLYGIVSIYKDAPFLE